MKIFSLSFLLLLSHIYCNPTAKELKVSDKLLLSDGTCAIIENVKIEQLSEPETTYNFEVEDFHTYYVSEANVLVHNRCKLGKNMIKEGQTLSSNEDAHHLFPQKFRDKFSKIGINVDDASNGLALDKALHRKHAQMYNKMWADVIDQVTKDNAQTYMKQIMLGAIISEQLAGAMGTATLGVQTIMIGAQSLSCNPVYGIIAMAVGAACVAFATAEAQEALGYGNWLKDTIGMSDEVYNGVMIAANIAAIAINIVGVKQCFKEGTLVACLNENGEEVRKPIESIAVGTFVLAFDEETGEKAYKPVVQLSRNTTKEWYHVCVNGEEIVCTGGHPFYVLNVEENRKVVRYEGVNLDKNGKWIEAKELKVSDKLLLSDGTCAIIENVKIEQLSEPETTYNFEVEDFHTYYVSDSNVLVHNMCKPTPNSNARFSIVSCRRSHKSSNNAWRRSVALKFLTSFAFDGSIFAVNCCRFCNN